MLRAVDRANTGYMYSDYPILPEIVLLKSEGVKTMVDAQNTIQVASASGPGTSIITGGIKL